jgi:flavin-dependent dehydrogenase
VPGFVSGRRLFNGLFLPSLDLLIPPTLIRGYPPVQRLLSPGGYRFEATFNSAIDFPAAVVDRAGLLRMLGDQAASAGADLRYGVEAGGLLMDEGRVTGVQTTQGPVRAGLVLAAEGTSRRLSQEAGLYGESATSQYALLAAQDMQVPAVTEADLGQIITFGQRYTSAGRAYGTVAMATPGEASVYLTVFTDARRSHPEQLAWFYLDEYVQRDPRVRELLQGGKVLHRARHTIAIRESPGRIVADGFMGLGDAVTPGGHVGILPALYLGRQAALVAAEALDGRGPSAEGLAPYEALFREAILPNLEAETRLMSYLTRMTDDEIDRLCQALNKTPLPTPFFSNWRTLTWEMMGWVMQQLPLFVQNWETLQRVMTGAEVELRV